MEHYWLPFNIKNFKISLNLSETVEFALIDSTTSAFSWRPKPMHACASNIPDVRLFPIRKASRSATSSRELEMSRYQPVQCALSNISIHMSSCATFNSFLPINEHVVAIGSEHCLGYPRTVLRQSDRCHATIDNHTGTTLSTSRTGSMSSASRNLVVVCE